MLLLLYYFHKKSIGLNKQTEKIILIIHYKLKWSVPEWTESVTSETSIDFSGMIFWKDWNFFPCRGTWISSLDGTWTYIQEYKRIKASYTTCHNNYLGEWYTLLLIHFCEKRANIAWFGRFTHFQKELYEIFWFNSKWASMTQIQSKSHNIHR